MIILLSKDEVLYLRQFALNEIIEREGFLKVNCFDVMEFIKKCYKYVVDDLLSKEGIYVKNKILLSELENNYINYNIFINTISLLRIYPAISELDINLTYQTAILIDSNYNVTIKIYNKMLL